MWSNKILYLSMRIVLNAVTPVCMANLKDICPVNRTVTSSLSFLWQIHYFLYLSCHEEPRCWGKDSPHSLWCPSLEDWPGGIYFYIPWPWEHLWADVKWTSIKFLICSRRCKVLVSETVPFWATHRPSQGDALVSQTFQACRQRECPWKCPCVDGTRGGCYPPPPCHPRCTQPQAGNITQRVLQNTSIGLIQSVCLHNNAEMQHKIKNTTCVFSNNQRNA